MVLENRVTRLESQVLKKEDLYTRWEHATKQEIAELCEESKLRTYLHHKGPINGVLFCVPAYVWHDDRWYHDENITYFLLEDVELCEKEYPDFVGNVSPGNMTFQEYTPAEEVRKQLGMSPIQFVDMLNGQKGPRLVTSWEEWYRAGESHWFETDKIDEITVHRFDLQGYLQERAQQIESIPNSTPDGQIDFSAVLKPSYTELEEQLVASQKQIEENSTLRQWNKRLNEQNQELRVELEKTVSAAHEEMRNIGEQAKTSIHNVSAAGDEVVEELQVELAEKESRIAELEKQLADMQKNAEALPASEPILQEKDALISELQSELETLRKFIGGYGALSLMVGMLEAGSTKEDIAKHLKEKGGLSYSQVGVLLHENPLNVGDSAITMCAKRLLGIA